MSFFVVTDHYGGTHSLTAKQLYERIVQDSKYDYNWIAPARELVRICEKTSFPAKYALAIKIAILNCFANIEHGANCGGDRYMDDTEEAVSARKRYLTEMINTATYVRIFSPLYHPGPTFIKLREDFIKSKFEEYISQEKIDFKQLIETLNSNFSEIIMNAEANGDFEEDKKKDRESWKMFYQRLEDI